MAVKLRLTRMGRKKRPFYRIVAVDSRAPRDGAYLENLGYYDPLKEPAEVKIKEERVLYWLGVGAIPTDTVRSLLRREGVLFKWDLIRRGLSEEEMAEKMKMWEVIQLERRRKLEKKLAGKKAAPAGPEEETPAEAAPEESAQETGETVEAAAAEEAAVEEAAPAEEAEAPETGERAGEKPAAGEEETGKTEG